MFAVSMTPDNTKKNFDWNVLQQVLRRMITDSVVIK